MSPPPLTSPCNLIPIVFFIFYDGDIPMCCLLSIFTSIDIHYQHFLSIPFYSYSIYSEENLFRYIEIKGQKFIFRIFEILLLNKSDILSLRSKQECLLPFLEKFVKMCVHLQIKLSRQSKTFFAQAKGHKMIIYFKEDSSIPRKLG